MVAARKPGRRNRLDLIRRANALGVTPGHLSRVLSGERQSPPLIRRLVALMDAESAGKLQTNTQKK
jgi:transcriptional regulator with XRE-family HTH domain